MGGFRLGLEKASKRFKVVWSNQWEPSTKRQDASFIYTKQFGPEHHSNTDINEVSTKTIPDHDLLVGGFPCQDYSVANRSKYSKGIEGKKGVLWWQIHRILKEKRLKPKYLMFENVDRLLKSPSIHRGRDFATILHSLTSLGYIVEWRVINAADYGMPQRRRRVFILGYHKKSSVYQQIKKLNQPHTWLTLAGIFAKSFPVQKNAVSIATCSINPEEFAQTVLPRSPFANTGIAIKNTVHTLKTSPSYTGPKTTLGDILVPETTVPQKYFISRYAAKRWKQLKKGKKEKRISKVDGKEYWYREGDMPYPDLLNLPSRTVITSEGESSASRTTHVVRTPKSKLRRLVPVELERLNMFPDNHTEGITDMRRAFCMGNALVTGVVRKLGKRLAQAA